MISKNNMSSQRSRQYRRFYVPCFIVFLVATLVGRLMPWNWRFSSDDAADRKSIIQEAKELAGTCVPYMFANY